MTLNPFFQTSQKIIHAYNYMCIPVLEEFKIPQVSFDILMFLTNNPTYFTAQDICEMRHIKKNLVSVHVDKLVNAGLLKRNPVTGDRRKIALSCTEKAEPIINAGIRIQQMFYRRISFGITEEQRVMLTEIENILVSNSERIIADPLGCKAETLTETR